jgi:hypothetical protein
MKVDVIESKTKPTQLIQAETVTVCRNGGPAVDIVRTKQRKRKPKLGLLRNKMIDRDWWKPMTDDEVEDLLGRR